MSIGQRHFCQAQAAGVVVQSTIIIEYTCRKVIRGKKKVLRSKYALVAIFPFLFLK